METQLIVRIDSEIKNKFVKISKMEGKTTSEKIREIVTEYIETNDFSSIVEDIWNGVSKKAEAKGIGDKDIEDAITTVRAIKQTG